VPKSKVYQRHHLAYPDGKHSGRTVKIGKGAHWVITKLNQIKYPDKGLLVALMIYIAEHAWGDEVVSEDKGTGNQ
jgi:hypothetical protein